MRIHRGGGLGLLAAAALVASLVPGSLKAAIIVNDSWATAIGPIRRATPWTPIGGRRRRRRALKYRWDRWAW